MAKFASFCGKIWQNLGFSMAIFCDASTTAVYRSTWHFVLFPDPLKYISIDRSAGWHLCLIQIRFPPSLPASQILKSCRARFHDSQVKYSCASNSIKAFDFLSNWLVRKSDTLNLQVAPECFVLLSYPPPPFPGLLKVEKIGYI